MDEQNPPAAMRGDELYDDCAREDVYDKHDTIPVIPGV
eukprot:CAMPEP_0175057160 /NCGR_PEP_ID=MMETSP0052_2-20121109/11104_1 /TAXON_ID=51329 ORGANISM="Polytomella parva, Strain SAG 63-3" /NCGR_SAMPLE_ID=MMETSP0052_2 /ASSEMBLY_ACC=CAM_ASM_000194 /LENGTH=37 /DNA_ID= /DNA_START= /DNA_END= /DNA_ORIENTATION=